MRVEVSISIGKQLYYRWGGNILAMVHQQPHIINFCSLGYAAGCLLRTQNVTFFRLETFVSVPSYLCCIFKPSYASCCDPFLVGVVHAQVCSTVKILERQIT